MNRFIGSNLWVSPWIARDNKLKSALVSVFTQLLLISKLICINPAGGKTPSSSIYNSLVFLSNSWK